MVCGSKKRHAAKGCYRTSLDLQSLLLELLYSSFELIDVKKVKVLSYNGGLLFQVMPGSRLDWFDIQPHGTSKNSRKQTEMVT